MTTTAAKPEQAGTGGRGGFTARFLDGVERLGNKVPHPVLMFLYLIIGVIVLSHILYLLNVSVTEQIAEPAPVTVQPDYPEQSATPSGDLGPEVEATEAVIKEETIPAKSLLTAEGMRFIFTGFVGNFAAFTAMSVSIIALLGAGIAEQAGMMGALIRKLVQVAPRRLFTFILTFVGVLSSIASDAGYLILIPLAAVAFMTLGRHPLAGMATAFAGVGGIFLVNIFPTPTDSILIEITNEAITAAGGTPLPITADFYFAAASAVVMAIVATLVTERIVEPRLGAYRPEAGATAAAEEPAVDTAGEARGLKAAFWGFLGVLVLVLLLTLPPGAPLRSYEGSETSPFLSSLLFVIFLFFLVSGICYGFAAGTYKSKNDVVKAGTKAIAGLGGLIFMFLMISQFIALFNYSNMPRLAAVTMAGMLEQANFGALPLLVGMVVVLALLDLILPGAVPKWAIFAPVFVPLFMRLGVGPAAVFSAYRVGDSPVNVITPLMVYLPFIVTIAQKYQKNAGIGTVVALMMPYTIILLVAWILFGIAWFLLGIPIGPGS